METAQLLKELEVEDVVWSQSDDDAVITVEAVSKGPVTDAGGIVRM